MNASVPKTICEKEKKGEKEKNQLLFHQYMEFKKRNRISTYDFPEENRVKPPTDNRYNVN